MMMDRRAVAAQPARAGQQRSGGVRHRSGFAQRGTSFRTREAMSATRDEYHHDVVAARQVVHAGADFLDRSGRLVPERHRDRSGAIAVDYREVGVAQPGRADPHEHFAVPGRLELQLLDGQRLRFGIWTLYADTVQHRRADFHCCVSPR
jgi:hypothetical protein